MRNVLTLNTFTWGNGSFGLIICLFIYTQTAVPKASDGDSRTSEGVEEGEVRGHNETDP